MISLTQISMDREPSEAAASGRGDQAALLSNSWPEGRRLRCRPRTPPARRRALPNCDTSDPPGLSITTPGSRGRPPHHRNSESCPEINYNSQTIGRRVFHAAVVNCRDGHKKGKIFCSYCRSVRTLGGSVLIWVHLLMAAICRVPPLLPPRMMAWPPTKEVIMTIRLLNATALAAMLAAGSVFAADAPAPAATPSMPPTTMTSTVPAAATAAPASSLPARHVSACTVSIHQAEKALATSKQTGAMIAVAWQHLDAAKQARMSHQSKACVSESHTAARILAGKA